MLLGTVLGRPPLAHAAEPLPPQVVVELQHGSFVQALSDLRDLPESRRKEVAQDAERLDYATTLVELGAQHADAGRRSEVERLVAELRKQELGASNLAYQEGVQRLSNRWQERLRQVDAPGARRSLKIAQGLLRDNDLTAADNVFKSLLEAPDQHLPEIVAQARAGRAAVLRGSSAWASEGAKAKSALSTLTLWALGLGLGWSLLRLIRWVLGLFPRSAPYIELTEADAAGSTAATRQLVERLMLPAAASGGLSIDTIEDLDRSGLSNISLDTHDAEGLKEIASSTERISVAGISFTPQQLYALLLPLRRPYAAEYSGHLRQSGDVYRVSLRIRDEQPGAWFSCEAASRDEALAEVADHIAFRASPWRLSNDWQSFRAYRRAQRLLQQPRGASVSEHWLAARELLEEAIEADPKNIAALYRLGVLLRRVGKNSEAEGVLKRLDAQLQEVSPPAWLCDFLQRNPDFKASVRYDFALSLAKQDDKLDEALALLKQLEPPPRAERSLDASAPGRFALLAMSAAAAVWAGKLGIEAFNVPKREKQAWYGSHAKDVADQITRRRQDLEAYRADPQLEHLRVCSSALAVALAAEGRALYLRNQLHQAERTLRRARAENPRLACAAVHLAQVLKDTHGSDEAIGLLQRALELSPRNAKAHYLLGNLYLFRQKDPEAARPHLEHAREYGGNAATDLVYARCLQELGRKDDAREALYQSVREFEQPVNYRYEMFLSLLAEAGTPAPEQASQAQWCFERVRRFLSGADLKRCEELMSKMGLVPRS